MSESSIFQYTDYRSFLKDRYLAARRRRPRLSQRAWAQNLAIQCPSTLSMILTGKRNPGPALTKALATALKLSAREQSYFFDLVELAKASNDPSKVAEVFARITHARYPGHFRTLDSSAFASISSWYCFAIREMVRLNSFQNDPLWVASHLAFPISLDQARQALRILTRSGFLKREKGHWRLSDAHIETLSDQPDEGIKKFHEQSLDNARKSLRRFSPMEREVFGTTFAMPKKSLPEAKALIRKFHEDMSRLLEKDGTDAVFHLETAFFPVALERGST